MWRVQPPCFGGINFTSRNYPLTTVFDGSAMMIKTALLNWDAIGVDLKGRINVLSVYYYSHTGTRMWPISAVKRAKLL